VPDPLPVSASHVLPTSSSVVARDPARIEYPAPVAAAAPSFTLKALLLMGLACAALHLAHAAATGALVATQRNVSWLSGFWGWYYVLGTACRAALASALVAGTVGAWAGRPAGPRWAVGAAAGLIGLGLVELAASLVSYAAGPPRGAESGGVMLSIARTFLTRYGVLLLLVYELKRPARQGGTALPG